MSFCFIIHKISTIYKVPSFRSRFDSRKRHFWCKWIENHSFRCKIYTIFVPKINVTKCHIEDEKRVILYHYRTSSGQNEWTLDIYDNKIFRIPTHGILHASEIQERKNKTEKMWGRCQSDKKIRKRKYIIHKRKETTKNYSAYKFNFPLSFLPYGVQNIHSLPWFDFSFFSRSLSLHSFY